MSSRRRLKILIVCCGPYGRVTDAHELSRYLLREHDVTYLCFENTDSSYPEAVPAPSLVVKRVVRDTSRLQRAMQWLKACVNECGRPYDVVYLYYFPLSSLVRFANPGRAIILDIRSGAVAANALRRTLLNFLIWIDSLPFAHISVLCEAMRLHLRLPRGRTHIRPLGAHPVSCSPKCFNDLHLLYVGTFFNRRIEDTLRGLSMYIDRFSGAVRLRYTIIGDSPPGERERLLRVAAELGLSGCVEMPGYIPRHGLEPYYRRANVGVSYVPIVPYYDCQPPTKTYEYLFAGMPVIATATKENPRLITSRNGVLIRDTPNGFSQGLVHLYSVRRLYDSELIKASVVDYSWDNIMMGNALPFIESVAADGQR